MGACAAAFALASALPASAQYKVVGPDGRITYTDRPPAEVGSRVVPFSGRSGAAAPEAVLPLELRTVAARFPVTLYVSTAACDTCEAARTLLRARGIPHDERSVATADDLDALERATGSRGVPTLRLGAQVLPGLAPETWHGWLDTAGYPRESKLPPAWRWSAATPLTEPRAAAAPPRPARAAPPAERSEPPPAEGEPGPIRF